MPKAAVPPYDWTDADDARLRALWVDCMLIRDIARAIGCTYHQAWKRRVKIGLPDRSKHHGGEVGSYWGQLKRSDGAFAEALAGRSFDSIAVSPDPRRMPRRTHDAGKGASSMELNA